MNNNKDKTTWQSITVIADEHVTPFPDYGSSVDLGWATWNEFWYYWGVWAD